MPETQPQRQRRAYYQALAEIARLGQLARRITEQAHSAAAGVHEQASQLLPDDRERVRTELAWALDTLEHETTATAAWLREHHQLPKG